MADSGGLSLPRGLIITEGAYHYRGCNFVNGEIDDPRRNIACRKQKGKKKTFYNVKDEGCQAVKINTLATIIY